MASTNDRLVQTLDQPIKLPVFEGPLDLLLFLIRKNELDIYDIPIEDVTRQYLDILYSMEQLKLEIAGEFFVMAATLMQIKSRMLLPKDDQLIQGDDEEEDVDPRWELVQQLIEYKRFKDAAADLQTLINQAQDLIPRDYRTPATEIPARPLKGSDKVEIWNVFNKVVRRLAEKIVVGNIHDEVVTVADRMEFILQELKARPFFRFSELFDEEAPTIHQLVATFIAVLELTRTNHVTIEQEGAFEDIAITRRTDPAGPVESGTYDASNDANGGQNPVEDNI